MHPLAWLADSVVSLEKQIKYKFLKSYLKNKRNQPDLQTSLILINAAQKMQFSIEDFFSKCNQIRRKLWIWSHLIKKSSMKNGIFLCSSLFTKYEFVNIRRSIFRNLQIYFFQKQLKLTDCYSSQSFSVYCLQIIILHIQMKTNVKHQMEVANINAKISMEATFVIAMTAFSWMAMGNLARVNMKSNKIE